MAPSALVGLDVGGSTLKGALVGPDGALGHRIEWPTPAGEGPEAVLDAVVTALGELGGLLEAEAGLAGVVVPGLVDEADGVVELSANLGWKHLRLAEELGRATGLVVRVRHDVRAAADAEHRLGASASVPDSLFVALGTGIAAGLVLDGRLRRGGGELGHGSGSFSDAPCGCGRHGCLETVASGWAMQAAYRAAVPGATADAGAVLRLAAAGDEVAIAVLERAVAALACSLAGAHQLLDLDLVVVGGGLSGAGEALLQPLRHHLDSLVLAPAPAVVRSALGGDAGVIGAGLLAWDSFARRIVPPKRSATTEIGEP